MYKHMTVTPRFLLAKSDKDLAEVVVLTDGYTIADARADLQDDEARGVRYPVGRCDNWDEENYCCLGHEERDHGHMRLSDHTQEAER